MDYTKKIKALDKEGMLQVLRAFPQQFEEAVKAGRKFRIPKSFRKKRFENVFMLGMGGSGIGGLMVKNLLHEKSRIPIEVNPDYKLPAMAGKNSLVFAVSYSGNTEETISGYKEALKRKASIVALTSNGKLAKKSKNTIIIPPGFPPRTQLAFAAIPMLVVMQRLGLTGIRKELLEAPKFLKKQNREIEKLGKKLAETLYKKIPVIYGPKHLETALLRFHTQLAENSKSFSHWNVFPELTHNELVGYKPKEKDLLFVFFRDKKESPKMRNRIGITKRIIRKHSKVLELWVKGKNLTEKLFYASLAGDYCSYYLALLNNAKPWPIPNIKYLKKKIRE